ncbi:MAG: FGGY family carbohydrate kinase [Acidimicrobiales bacterium]|jgi:xylulokinase|nr:FGGY family carbohydrate kinase [Acidimicrobiales bacterium]
MAHALGIDVGTTNAKVAVVRDDGTLVATGSSPIPLVRSGDRAGIDPEALWSAVVSASRSAVAEAGPAAADVRAVACCSQYSSIVPVDRAGRPTAELVVYLDQRGTDHCWAIAERHPQAFDLWLERHGVPPVGSGLSLAHLLHLQLDRPEVHAATATWLEPMDFVNLRLTGTVTATQATMFTAQLCDNRSLGVTAYDDELVALSGVDPSRLPPLVSLDAVAGTLLPAVAAEVGLPAGVPVLAGMNDSHAGAIATGAHRPGVAGVMIGTTSVLLDTTAAMHDTDLDHEVLSMPSPLPATYLVWAENGLGGKALEHVLAHVVHATDELADHATSDHFEHLDRALAAVAAGSGGVLFLPWLAGSMSPRADPLMRGGFLNLSLDSRRTDLVRAVIEGICHNLAWLLPVVEGFGAEPVAQVVFGGGAARSTLWAQILADVLDRPVTTLHEPDQANARAVGLWALRGAGVLGTEDLVELIRTGPAYDPDPAARGVYAAMHEQYLAAFDALRPLYHALNGG